MENFTTDKRRDTMEKNDEGEHNMYCNNCGKEIDGTWKVCPYCGAKNENAFSGGNPQLVPQMNYSQPTPQAPYNQPVPQPSYNQQQYGQPINFNTDFINPAQPKLKKKSKLPIIITAVVLVAAIVLGAIFIPGLIKGKGEEDIGMTGGAVVANPSDPNAVWVISKICKDGEEIVFDYDALGNIVTEKRLNNGKETTKYAWSYNSSNKPVFMIASDSGVEKSQYTYMYNSSGCLTEVTIRGLIGDSPTRTTHIYRYDSAGRLIEDISKATFEDDPDDYTTYKYDSNGRLIEKVENEYQSWSSEFSETTTVYEYDANGNLIKESLVGKYYIDCYDVYEYDNSGNCIAKIEYSGGEENARYRYEYDANGNCIKASGTLYGTKEYTITIEYTTISVSDERRADIKENNQKKFDEYVYFGQL